MQKDEEKLQNEFSILKEAQKEVKKINEYNNEIEEKFIEKLGSGAKILEKSTPKNKWISLILCILAGYLRIHKFYEGRMFWALVYLFTGGLFYIGVILDIIFILRKPNPYIVNKNSFF